jgi:hypothetical protein
VVELTSDLVPWRSTARGSPEFIGIDAPGVKSTGSVSGAISASCVIFLGLRWGSGVLWAARAAVEVVLHGGAHRRAVFQSKQGPRSTTSSAKRTKGTC